MNKTKTELKKIAQLALDSEFYKICTYTKLYTVSKKAVEIIERAPL